MHALNRSRAIRTAVAAVSIVTLAQSTFGTNKVYHPTTASDTWNLDTNWGIIVPVSPPTTPATFVFNDSPGIPVATSRASGDPGDSADFRIEGIPADLQTAPVIIDTGADQAVTSLRFQGDALPDGGSYVINGNTITLYGLNNSNGVVYQIGSQVVINSNLKLASNTTLFSGGAGGLGITYNGVISEGATPAAPTRSSVGIATFNNLNNSFTNGLVITDGQLRVAGDGALGAPYTGATATGTTKVGQVTIKSGGSLTLLAPTDTNRPFFISDIASSSNSGFISVATGGFDSTFSNTVANISASSFGTLNKNGNGSLTLAVANTYSGGTMVSAGILKVATDANLGAAYDGSLVGFVIPVAGTGYVAATTTVTLTGGSPTTPASPTATVPASGTNAGTLTGITLTAGAGTGYVSNPTVAIVGAGTKATALAYVKGLLTLRNGGILQTTAPLTTNRPVVLTGTGGGTIDTNGFDSTFTGIFNDAGTNTGTLTKAGAGTLTLTAANTYAGLTTVTGGTLALAPLAQDPVLTLGGADIQAGKILLNYTTTSPAPTAFARLASGAIKNSNSANDPNQTVGMIDDGSKVTLAATYFGDANLDLKVNADDYARIDRGFAITQSGGSTNGWVDGDFNYSGTIDANDYLLIDTSFLSTGVPHEALTTLLTQRQSQFGDAYVSSLLAAVPEPTSLGALALAAAPLLRRRRAR